MITNQPWYLEVVWKMKVAKVMERMGNRCKCHDNAAQWYIARDKTIRQAAALIEW